MHTLNGSMGIPLESHKLKRRVLIGDPFFQYGFPATFIEMTAGTGVRLAFPHIQPYFIGGARVWVSTMTDGEESDLDEAFGHHEIFGTWQPGFEVGLFVDAKESPDFRIAVTRYGTDRAEAAAILSLGGTIEL